VYIKPPDSRLNGKVERSHRIDAEEFYRMLNGVVVNDCARRSRPQTSQHIVSRTRVARMGFQPMISSLKGNGCREATQQ